MLAVVVQRLWPLVRPFTGAASASASASGSPASATVVRVSRVPSSARDYAGGQRGGGVGISPAAMGGGTPLAPPLPPSLEELLEHMDLADPDF